MFELNKNHNWFYQIQGQLHITQRKFCVLGVWTPKGLKSEIIRKDDEFWETKMKSKLNKFFMNCLLPEIVDPRRARSMPLRECQHPNLFQKI